MIRLILAFCIVAHMARAETIILASTTSVENAGLLARILPEFPAGSGIAVRVIALGTGQALAVAARGDADLVLVHDPDAEAAFIAQGHGVARVEIAWNDFILVGPRADPARVAGSRDVIASLRAIAMSQTGFVSRGDGSGTDALEKRLWTQVGFNPRGRAWYREIGGGMGAALNMAAATDAITLTDRGTWLAYGNRRDLIELVSGDPALINRYNVIEMNPIKHPSVKIGPARRLASWLSSPDGQAAIGRYQIGGEQLFHPSVR